jgi:hypothetical protein
MKRNMSNLDRMIRAALAAVLAVLYFTGVVSGPLGIVFLVFAGVLALTAVIAFCPLYLPFKINTYRR